MERALADLDGLGAHNGRGSPTAGHHGGVADQPAACREDALAGHHPVDVLRAGLVAHQDDVLTALLGRHGVIGGEVDPADGGARRGGEPLADGLGLAGELRVQHLVEVLGGDAHDGVLVADLPRAVGAAGALAEAEVNQQPGCEGKPRNGQGDDEGGEGGLAVHAFHCTDDTEHLSKKLRAFFRARPRGPNIL